MLIQFQIFCIRVGGLSSPTASGYGSAETTIGLSFSALNLLLSSIGEWIQMITYLSLGVLYH